MAVLTEETPLAEVEVETNGKLTLLSKLGKDLIRAKCTCGAVVLIASEDWGSQYGCPLHHSGELARIEEAARKARQDAENAQRWAAREAELKDRNIDPHYESLKPAYRKLVRHLCDGYPCFQVGAIEQICKVDRRAAESILFELAGHNVLAERPPRWDAWRNYELETPYWEALQTESTFCIRPKVRKQVQAEIEAAVPLAQPEAEPPLEPLEALPADELVGRWLDARCTKTDSEHSTASAVLRANYCDWIALTVSTGELPYPAWSAVMDELGYSPKGGRVFGLRPLTKSELAQRTEPAEAAA